ncbi:UDP-N-acetylmuramoyl-L-alanyl-D-glutamate--2,6-diaminopimelate ligase [Candidatus Uhrbacteria bacterium]|nr:UDP-N-acetylmuramoyl-L-alanyl-D-glutamate--2,6-diaminopimelate ligase [Candidatus Uhrbacteria bacterium]
MLKSVLRCFVPESVIGAYHYCLARAAAFLYGHPSEKLVVIGVTGTNGKSTTVQFIGRLLEHAGHRVGWTTTASFKVAEREWVNDKKMTMLGRFQTQKLLREMVSAGCRYAVIETSSQGIAQSRHIGINYDVAVFTNLTPEHIEAHGGFENYKAAKLKLFEGLGRLPRKTINDTVIEKSIVVNLQDPHAESFLACGADRYSGFAVGEAGTLATRLNTTPMTATDVNFTGSCTTFTVGETTYHLKPAGRFYLENALAAMATVKVLGVSPEVMRHGVESLDSVPGRLERIDEGQPFTVIVDYAYEPAALTAVYDTLKLVQHKRLIHILGSAGGGRDVARREILGRLAAAHDDIVIVTNEDPYDEDPESIIDEVANAARAAGKQEGVNLFKILDRGKAIQFAVDLAVPHDLVLITGKGSEPIMAVAGGKKIPWDDRVAARKALHALYGGS